MEKLNFYVYAYLDPRKKSNFTYEKYIFNYEPFYIGKGNGTRLDEHLRESQLKEKTLKNKKIKKILNEGLSPIIIKISSNLFENDAFELEIKLIKIIGRLDLKTGPLTNLTNGGDGISGLLKTKKHRSRLSLSLTGIKRSKETRKKISLSLTGKPGRNTGNKHSNETKDKISKSKKGTLSWNAIPILQLTKDEKIIKEWISSTAAAKNLNLSQGNIWSVINGNRKTCGNYKWKVK